jgi:putative ABC transport system permease protein
MIKNYFKIAWRNLIRHRVYSFINIAGLSMGLAAAMLIMLYAKDEVSYDQFHANNPNIYRIVNQWIKPDGSVLHGDGNTGDFQGPKFKDKIPEILTYTKLRSPHCDIRNKTEVKSYEMLSVESNFFSIFTFPLLSGDPTTALQNPYSIVISEDMAERFFGTKQAVGKTLDLKKDSIFEPYLITGVAKKCPQNSSIKFDFLLPLEVPKDAFADNENWFSFFQNTFVMLTPKADIKAVEAKMKQIYESDAAETIKSMRAKYDIKENAKYSLQPLTAMHLDTEYSANNGLSDSSNPMYSYILSGIALFILLIACINFVNLTVARSLKRAKEIGVRKVVGGDRKQLILQFLGESFTLSAISFLLAFVIVKLVLPAFNHVANKELALSYLYDWKLIVGFIALFIITGLLAGFYPALVMSRFNPVQTLYGRLNLSGKNYLQKSLVVLQFALASFLIIATLTIHSQFNYLIHKDLGYDDKNIVLVENIGMEKDKALLFKQELLKNSNIETVAPKNGGFWGKVARINGGTQILFAYETVDEDYLPTFKIPLLQGRNFSKDFPSDSSSSVLVNEAFAKKAAWTNPVGQVIDFITENNKKYTVVGVVKDYHFKSLTQEIEPQLFTMKKDNNYGLMYMKIKPNSETASLAYISKTFKNIFPFTPYSYEFKDLANIKGYESEAQWKQIMLFGAFLTIFISCIGLFGLATLAAEKRAKEIGIRKVLGASVSHVVRLLSTDFLKLVSLSFIFSFPIAYFAAQKWLQSYPYRPDFNWSVFGFTALITVCVALLTVSFQAVKAAVANPVKSLRTE